MNTDLLNSVSRENTAKVVFRLLDRMQDFPPAEQVAAVSVLFLSISRTLDLSPQQLLSVSNNITKFDAMFKDEQDKVFDAVLAYVEGELS